MHHNYFGAVHCASLNAPYSCFDSSERNRSDRTTGYFNNGDKEGIIDFVNKHKDNGEPINLIGHSYGATTAIAAAKALAKQGVCVDNLIGIDGVRKPFQRGNPGVLTEDCLCTNIVGVNSTAGGTPGDAIEILGKILGGGTTLGAGTPRAFRPKHADTYISSNTPHGDFRGAYNAVGSNGLSAKGIVDGSY